MIGDGTGMAHRCIQYFIIGLEVPKKGFALHCHYKGKTINLFLSLKNWSKYLNIPYQIGVMR